ncbi:Phenoloxidase-activating factor 2, partial [Gryllus bimaculatus]
RQVVAQTEVSREGKSDVSDTNSAGTETDARQAPFGNHVNRCGPRYVCCRRPGRPQAPQRPLYGQCGRRNAQGVNGRIKTPVYVDGDSEFGEYPWQAAILKKDTHESVYVCGGTLIDAQHIITAAHCVKTYSSHDLRVRLGEWDVNHDVEFYPYVERDVSAVVVHPEFYAGTLYNDLAVLRLSSPVDLQAHPHISPACLPQAHVDYAGSRCWTTGWGKDAFGDYGKYQNILKEVDVPVVSHHQCQAQLQQTRLGYDFKLHPGMVCAGGEEGKDACK